MTVNIGRIGVWTLGGLLDLAEPAELGEIGAELEQAGYGAMWIGAAKAALPHAEQILSATRAFAFATGIINVWSEPVDEVVASYHRVSSAYPDRLLLGTGAGHRETAQKYQRPYEKLIEYLDALAAAKPPVPADNTVLAALGPKVLALAAARTAGAHPYLTTPEHTRQAREILGAGPLLAPEQKVVLEADPAKARAIGRLGISFYLGLANYVANLRRLGFTDADFADGGSDRLVDALVAWGDPDTIAKRVGEHLDAGADHVCIQVITEDGRSGTREALATTRSQWRILGPALAG